VTGWAFDRGTGHRGHLTEAANDRTTGAVAVAYLGFQKGGNPFPSPLLLSLSSFPSPLIPSLPLPSLLLEVKGKGKGTWIYIAP